MKPQNSTSSTLRLVWQEMILPFWTRSPRRGRAWIFLIITLALIGGSVYCLVLLNKWNQAFYDAIQNLNRVEFFKQLLVFFLVAATYVLIKVYKFYIMQLLMVQWREWLTEENLQRWLSHRSYYFWHFSNDTNDNPDQRLSEDLRELTELVLNCGEKIFRELITFVSFIGILWALSGSFIAPNLGGYRIEVSHYLVWVCLIYAVVGTGIVHLIGKPLIALNFFQQKFEADFRYFLVRLRENSEGIALLRGEPVEEKNLLHRLRLLIRNYRGIITKQKQLLLADNTYSQLAYIFPFVVASPQLFAKQITMGQLFQISSAFGQVQGSVSVFITLYAELARLKSVVDRLGGFLESVQNTRRLQDHARSPLRSTEQAQLSIQNLTLATPFKKTLLKNLNRDIALGQRILIKAPSGTGKSTLIRSLQHLWPYQEGQIQWPKNRSSLTLPQKPYLLVDTLKASLTYPHPPASYADDELLSLLEVCRLGHLKESLHLTEAWDQKLSPGEQQRVSFARVLLQKPDIVFLDEATSALDEETQTHLYRILQDRHPQMTVISVAPREILTGFHHEIWDLQNP